MKGTGTGGDRYRIQTRHEVFQQNHSAIQPLEITDNWCENQRDSIQHNLLL